MEKKKQQRKPVAPFTTSTLQQEASRKLGFSAKQTMQLAQRLYEAGLITYMRTDSVNLSEEAVAAIRDMIKAEFGDRYLPKAAVSYEAKSKNAQEAHEAIRPSHFDKPPAKMQGELDAQQARLYELVWKRAVACQMTPAELDLVAADIVSESGAVFRANGSMLAFDGFMKLYREDMDDAGEGDDDNKMLPHMAEGDPAKADEIKPEQHFTQPPPRYSEASLVKRMEELGIGRPSTYASILSVIQERSYVSLEKKKFVATERGRIVSAFLEKYFPKYVENDFTAFMEDELDDVSNGKLDYKKVLADFWGGFSKAIEASNDLGPADVVNSIDAALGEHFFPKRADGSDPRKCPDCSNGRLGIKLGKFGGFVGCSNYPACKYTKPLITVEDALGGDGPSAPRPELGQSLGKDENGTDVYLKNGPYGPYLQLGEVVKGDLRGPARVSIPKGVAVDALTLEQALFLLSMPRPLGKADDGEDIALGAGKFGPYVKKGGAYKNLPPGQDIFAVDLEMAKSLLQGVAAKPRGKELGLHPDDSRPVVYFSTGKYGPYVQHNRTFASVKSEPTFEEAVEKLRAKEGAKK